jgi:hypothetical protein
VEAVSARGSEGPGDRGRTVASIALAVLGALLVFIGAVLLYVRAEIIDERAFADKAAEALATDATRDLISTEIVVGLIENGSPDLVAARPLLESVVDTVIDSRPFREIFRGAAGQANRLLFVRDRDNVAFNLSDTIKIVRFGLDSVSPQLAKELPREVDLALVKLKEREFARESLDLADSIRVLGIVAPILALLALVLSVVVAPDRRAGVMRAALAAAAAGTALAIALLILRARTLAGVIGEDEVTDEEARAAVGGILDAYLGDLFSWALLIALTGLIVAGAAAVLDHESAEDPATRLRRRLTQRPRTGAAKALRATAAIGVGFLVALEPQLALGVVGLLAGAYLIYFGTGELLLMLQPRDRPAEEQAKARRRSLVRTGVIAAGAIAVVAISILVVTGREGPRGGATTPRSGCNGSPELCDLRLNEVVFAGTHNSFSAADSGDWFIANQLRTIDRQLADGIRLFLIDLHWGVADKRGQVLTDFDAEGRNRNKVAKALPPATLAAAQRLAGNVGIGPETGGEREVWLCHTVCELGATRAADTLVDIREFLDDNPGEVVILFIEPYVSPSDIESTFEAAGLDRYAAVLDRGAPLPTLGELVRSDHRLVVFTEQDADGTVPWYLDGFSFVQDTPLGATRVDQLSCKLNRGEADSPILMLNHWADVFPPRRGANAEFLTRKAIIDRAHRCARQRGLDVGLIATDHYDQGELIESVEALNRERIKAAEGRAGG